MGEEKKKPFYEKAWFWIMAVIILATIGNEFSNGSKDSANKRNDITIESSSNKDKSKEEIKKEEAKKEELKKEEAKKEEAKKEELKKEEAKKEEAKKEELKKEEAKKEEVKKEEAKKEEPKKTSRITAGTYKVGTDIPPGEYLVLTTGSMCYIEAAKDSTGKLESIIFNDNLMKGNSYVTLNNGEYFKLQGGEMYPVAEAKSIIPASGLYTDGMYKVGIDIPAGEYKVVLDSAMGYVEVSANSTHKLEAIITNDNLTADSYITVSQGQYLKISGVKIQK